jgi:hypothetical protein
LIHRNFECCRNLELLVLCWTFSEDIWKWNIIKRRMIWDGTHRWVRSLKLFLASESMSDCEHAIKLRIIEIWCFQYHFWFFWTFIRNLNHQHGFIFFFMNSFWWTLWWKNMIIYINLGLRIREWSSFVKKIIFWYISTK